MARRDVGGFVGIVFAFGACPRTANSMNLVMFVRVMLALSDGFESDGGLHLAPLRFGDFEFVNAEWVVDVAVRHPRVHGHGAMGFEWSIDAAHDSAFLVERAGATTLRAALT